MSLGEPGLEFRYGISWLLVVVGLAVAAKLVREDNHILQKIGWACWPIAMNASFVLLGPTLKNATHWRADGALQAVDSVIVGENLSVRFQAISNAAITNAMSTGYLFFMLLLFASMLFYIIKSPHLKRCFVGLFSVYGIGFLGYVILPAEGPYLAMSRAFSKALEGGFVTNLNAEMVMAGSNHVDVFPSLHIAVSLFIWVTLLKDFRKVALALFPLMVLLWTSTIYLRYHYFIDVLAGTMLALVVFAMTRNLRCTD